VSAVEVVAGVELGAGLLGRGNAGVEVPVVGARDVDQAGAVDVDGGGRSEPALGVEQHGEVGVVEGAHGLRGDRQRNGSAIGLPREKLRVVSAGRIRHKSIATEANDIQ